MKKILAITLALILALSSASFVLAEQPLTTIRYFPGNAMAGSGELSGWNGKFFAEHGLIVEVIPFSAEKLQAMLASGDMADIMWLPQPEMLIAAESGMLLNLDEHLDKLPNVTSKAMFEPSFEYAREYNSNDTGNLYYLGQVAGPSAEILADSDRAAIKMNWEIYKGAGYPSFSTLEEVIPVLKQMQELHPTSKDGLPTYGMHLFTDFDTTYFYNMYSVYAVLGKSETYLPYGIEWDVRTHTGHSIFDEDSVYYRGLKFMYEMNKAGLIDPDSMSQTRSTAKAKIDGSAALAGWAANPGWEAGGYYPVVFDEFVPNYGHVSPYAVEGYCISASSQNVDAALKFLDILATEDYLIELRNGPRGTTWDFDENGNPSLTENYYPWAETGESTYPLEDGTSWEFWNNGYALGNFYVSEKYSVVMCCANWPDMYEYRYSTPVALDWAEHYGYPYLKALMDDKGWDRATETEGSSSFLTVDDDDMIMIKAALKDIIVPGSWQMVFAGTEEEFDRIWNDMKAKCESLGINDIIQFKLDDIAQAREVLASLSTD